MKAKYQDNLEMLQWIKRYFDLNYNGSPYDALNRRKGAQLYLIGGGNNLGPGLGPVQTTTTTTAPMQRPATAHLSQGMNTGGAAKKINHLMNGA